MSNPAFDVITAIMSTADAFMRESRRLFRPFGITGAQYNVLNLLASAECGRSQRELSELLVVDRSNVTGLIDRMEEAGWVTRQDDPADRRVYRIVLTKEGRRLWERVHPRYLDGVAAVTRGLSPKEMKTLIAALRRLEEAAPDWRKKEAPCAKASAA